jgi:hypothetical protein
MKFDFFSLKNDEKITITSQFSAYNSLELPTDIQDLMEQAVAVRKRLCPLFKIPGAALLLDNGKCFRFKSRKCRISFRPMR